LPDWLNIPTKLSSLRDSEAVTAGQVAGPQFIDQIEFERSNGLTTGATLAPGSGSRGMVSDRNVKANFSAVDGQALLARGVSVL
jgi:hypothetical protein